VVPCRTSQHRQRALCGTDPAHEGNESRPARKWTVAVARPRIARAYTHRGSTRIPIEDAAYWLRMSEEIAWLWHLTGSARWFDRAGPLNLGPIRCSLTTDIRCLLAPYHGASMDAQQPRLHQLIEPTLARNRVPAVLDVSLVREFLSDVVRSLPHGSRGSNARSPISTCVTTDVTSARMDRSSFLHV
jgi:hypothetical protein